MPWAGVLKFLIFCTLLALLYGLYQDGTVTKIVTDLGVSRCKTKWAKSGFDAQWDLARGCSVYLRGTWVPEGNVQVPP